MIEQSKPKKDAKGTYVLCFNDEDQRARLKARAALNRRTLNAEILFLIERGQEAVDGKREA
jgi:hypothetical protein